ncbi:MAG: hypothetical protein M1817_000998 [Caeruleum heppii]|nr:MAG: hypothetical protein M1817_000998 [Caeruleum heppii]
MAGPDVDIAQLSETQQLALQQFTSVTDQELQAAVPLLERSQWNVQIAIAKFFDGEAPDPVAEARASLDSQAGPNPVSRRETLLDGSSSFSSAGSSAARLDPAPRIVPQPESEIARWPPLVLTILLTPFSIVLRLLSASYRLFSRLFPFLPRLFSGRGAGTSSQPSQRRDTTGRRPLNPRDTAARFIREFEEEHGSHELPFIENGYAQALDKAKSDLKFLLVILTSPEHDETVSFVQDTLLAPEVVSYIRDPQNHIILWAGNVQDSEAYQVSAALHCTKFPFAALITHTPSTSSTAMSVVTRIVGSIGSTAFVAKLRTAISQYSESLDGVRATRAARQSERNLREEQNSAYERSLAQDRERARQRREAEAARARQEREAKDRAETEAREAENLARWKRWRSQNLAAEPDASTKDVVRLSVRMASGERIVRRFSPTTTMEELYAFVACHDMEEATVDEKQDVISKPPSYEHKYDFRLVSPMPRTVYAVDEAATVVEQLGRSGNLIMEPIAEDGDEDEGEE